MNTCMRFVSVLFWKIAHIWKTLFTRFKLTGRKRTSVCPLRYDLKKLCIKRT